LFIRVFLFADVLAEILLLPWNHLHICQLYDVGPQWRLLRRPDPSEWKEHVGQVEVHWEGERIATRPSDHRRGRGASTG
jgi:hypothetical protein